MFLVPRFFFYPEFENLRIFSSTLCLTAGCVMPSKDAKRQIL